MRERGRETKGREGGRERKGREGEKREGGREGERERGGRERGGREERKREGGGLIGKIQSNYIYTFSSLVLLPTIGSSAFLRFQLRVKMKRLEADDKVINTLYIIHTPVHHNINYIV